MISAAILGVGLALLIGNGDYIGAHAGEDFQTYLRHTREWLAGGSFYDARQLAGPYTLQGGDSLYPPPVALLMVPFLVVPSLLWWAIPGAIVGWIVWTYRPSPLVWPILVACLVLPRSLGLIVYGNPSMWVAAAVAAGTMFGWPAVLAVLKPTLAPFALIGIRTKRWWIAAAVLGIVLIAMLPDCAEYVRAVANLEGQDLTYSLFDIPLVAVGLVAWFGATRRVA